MTWTLGYINGLRMPRLVIPQLRGGYTSRLRMESMSYLQLGEDGVEMEEALEEDGGNGRGAH